MGTPVLLVSTATYWLGTARIPRALARAGFDVALLTPRNALAEKSGYVGTIGHLPDDATPLQWLHAFAAMVKATAPRLVLPCDDMAFRLLQSLVHSPPQDLDPAQHLQLAALVRDSLGEPAWYRASVDKTLLPAAAEALGVRVPAFALMAAPEDGEAFAAAHGYPVAVKRGHGFAGLGVALCANAGALRRAHADLARPDAFDGEAAGARRLLVQAHVPGRALLYSVAAWKGAVLAGWAADKLAVNPPPTGPATVLRIHRSPEVRGFAETLARGFGMSGIFDLECMVDERSGTAYLIEINRRVAPGSHCGDAHGVDLCAALFAAVNGTPSPTRADLDPGEERIAVHFPQEWLRDPDSRYLRDHPADVPWDEPELLEAMLALRGGH
jgi:predicted ATP-grasp superfamily ATP-dependent carboligase